jgi:hypothetical protein
MLLNTRKMPWVSLRSAVAGDDTPIAIFDYLTSWPSSNTVKLADAPLHDANGILIAFHGTDGDNEALTYYKLYGRSKMNGAIFLLLTGVATLGAQACLTDPIDNKTAITGGLWADTITVTGGILTDLVDILDSGNDTIAMLKFDALNITDLYMELDIGAQATVYSIVSGW